MKPMLVAIASCTLLASAAPSARAQLEGTLFTSPEERAYLDYLREDFLTRSQEQGFDIAVPEIPIVPVEGEEVAPAQPVEFTLGAIITRRDGARTVWINNRSMEESELPDFLAITEANGIAALQVTHEGRRFVLKPGQTVNLTTGEILEEYQRPQVQLVPETSVPVDDQEATPPAGIPPENETADSAQGSSTAAEVTAPPASANVQSPAEGGAAAETMSTPALTEREAQVQEILSNLSDEELDLLTEAMRQQSNE